MGDSLGTDCPQMPKFLFVSGPSAIANKETRRHVAKTSYNADNRRANRKIIAELSFPLPWRRRPSLVASLGKTKPSIIRDTNRSSHSQYLVDYNHSLAGIDHFATYNDPKTGKEDAGFSAQSRDDSIEVDDASTAKISCGLLTVLSQAPTDAFRTYPLPWRPHFEEVVHFITHTLGSIVFGSPTGSRFDLIRDRDFPIALTDPATFHALLLSAGTFLDYFRRIPQYNARALWHKHETVNLINRRLEDPVARNSEGTLHAVVLIASIEHKWGFGHEVHVNGLCSLIISMGGLKELRKRPRLEHTIFSYGLTNPGMAEIANLAFLGSSQHHLLASQRQQMLASEFWSFLADIVVHSAGNPHLFEPYAALLKPGSAIYQLLIAPTWHATPLRPEYSIRLHERIRVNTLIYVHCTILKAQSQVDLDKTMRHLKWLLRCESSWSGSLRMLQYLLVKEETNVNLRDPDLAWKSLRLIGVMEWLRPLVFVQTTRYLLDLLTVGGWMAVIDLEQIRDDIFTDCT